LAHLFKPFTVVSIINKFKIQSNLLIINEIQFVFKFFYKTDQYSIKNLSMATFTSLWLLALMFVAVHKDLG
jgi:hypothetical protein